MRATAGGSVRADIANEVPKKTPLVSLWAVCTLLWSIFTPPHRTFVVRVLLFQPAWILRMVRQDAAWVDDLAACLFLHAVFTYATGAWRFPVRRDFAWLDFRDPTMHMYLNVFTLLGVCGLFAGSIVFRGHHLAAKEAEQGIPQQQRIDEQVLPPLILASRTSHSRLFPRKHAFSYSYLLVGIPVGIHGHVSGLLSVDSPPRGWGFHVDAADYLERGHAHLTLAEKLQRYLHRQGVTDRDYAFAYLVTAPRLFGYSFNPVSFWYLYDSDTRLKYMILEVNNTFDERRLYLLRADRTAVASAGDSQTSLKNGQDRVNGHVIFTGEWPKDFHVSPFNSRKGSYSLRAIDPLAAFEQTGEVRIDNTIVLRSSKEHAKIVARISSHGPPKDPTAMSRLDATTFVGAWFWVGFATFPRIAWEASRLFFRRNLHVWYRPEVVDTSISRPYTEEERLLEAFFKAFLSNATGEASRPLRVVYEPAHGENVEVVLYSPSFTYEEDHRRTLGIKVISPAFYSRFVHYAHAGEAFESECLNADEKNRTAVIERPELLPLLLDAIRDEAKAQPKTKSKQSAMEQIRWSCLRRLRCPPAACSYSQKIETPVDSSRVGVRQFSELDSFVRVQCDDRDIYLRIVTKLFLGERIAFGTPVSLVALDWLVRSVLLLASMLYSHTSTSYVDVLRPRRWDVTDLREVGNMMMLANLVHMWSFMKG